MAVELLKNSNWKSNWCKGKRCNLMGSTYYLLLSSGAQKNPLHLCNFKMGNLQYIHYSEIVPEQNQNFQSIQPPEFLNSLNKGNFSVHYTLGDKLFSN